MVCPVDDTTLGVPFVLPVKINAVAHFQVLYSWRQVIVMADQDGLVGSQDQDELLVPGTFIVIWKNSLDFTRSFNLDIALLIGKGVLESKFCLHAGRP